MDQNLINRTATWVPENVAKPHAKDQDTMDQDRNDDSMRTVEDELPEAPLIDNDQFPQELSMDEMSDDELLATDLTEEEPEIAEEESIELDAERASKEQVNDTARIVASEPNKQSEEDRSNNGNGQPPVLEVTPAPDPFDPASLRIPQDFAATLGLKKVLLTVPVRKPDKTWFVRVHQAEEYRLQTGVLEMKEDRELYLVAPHLWGELATETTFGLRALFTAINRQGVLFIWPVPLPGPDGKTNEWHRSLLEAATLAQKSWLRVQSNMSLGAYEVTEAPPGQPDPKWPDLPLQDILRIAFKNYFIDNLDHPVLRRLRGES